MEQTRDPALDSVDALDALCAAGFPDHVIRAAASTWGTWSAMRNATPMERHTVGWLARRGVLPEVCPTARSARHGALAAYRDASWPGALERIEDPPVLCDNAGAVRGLLYGVIGNCRGGRGTAMIHRSVDTAAAAGFGIVADTEPTGMIALRRAVAIGVHAVVVLHGDGAGDGGVGGVGARWLAEQVLDAGGAVLHLRGGGYGDIGRAKAVRCVVALAERVDVHCAEGPAGMVDAAVRCAATLGVDHTTLSVR